MRGIRESVGHRHRRCPQDPTPGLGARVRTARQTAPLGETRTTRLPLYSPAAPTPGSCRRPQPVTGVKYDRPTRLEPASCDSPVTSEIVANGPPSTRDRADPCSKMASDGHSPAVAVAGACDWACPGDRRLHDPGVILRRRATRRRHTPAPSTNGNDGPGSAGEDDDSPSPPPEPPATTVQSRVPARMAVPPAGSPASAPPRLDRPASPWLPGLLELESDLDEALEAIVEFVQAPPPLSGGRTCAKALDRLVPGDRRGETLTRPSSRLLGPRPPIRAPGTGRRRGGRPDGPAAVGSPGDKPGRIGS